MMKDLQTVKVTPGHIRADVVTNSFNEKDNTVEVVFATETPVKRYDWWKEEYYNEVLSVSEDAVDLTRLQKGASVLNSHSGYSLESVLGVVERSWIDTTAKEAHAVIRLSEEAEDAAVVNKIKKGIIRNISVGYSVDKYEISEPGTEDTLKVMRAVSWMPMEISFVAIPADFNSGVRKQENQDYQIVNIVNPPIMKTEDNKTAVNKNGQHTEKKRTAETSSAPAQEKKEEKEAVDTDQIRAEAVKTERARVSTITDLCTRTKLSDEFAATLIKEGTSVQDARTLIIEEVARRANKAPIDTDVHVTGEDEGTKTRKAIVDGIVARANPSLLNLKDNEKARGYRNMRLLDIAKERLRKAGVNYGMLNEQEIVKRAWSTTDFPDLLTNAFTRSLIRFYEGIPDAWRFIARQESVVDFREKTGVKVDGAVSFEEIPEGGEYKATPILQSDKATIKLKKYGRKYSITDIAIINDDLSIFSRLPRILALGAEQFQADAVWANVVNNADAFDGKSLFHNNHNNQETTGGNKKAPDETVVSLARTAMRRQKGPAGMKLGIRPRYLIVPPELQMTAEKLVSSTVVPDSTTNVNTLAGALEVVVSDQLTDKFAWYLLADPATNQADGLVYAYLNGQEGLRTESRVNWDTDAVEVKASMAFATAIWGWEGWFLNAGH